MTFEISGATRIAGVIGDPIAHSLSPAIHNAAFAALGMDWRFVAFPVGAGHAAAALAGARAMKLAGLSVTMPHKEAAAAAVDVLSPTAAALGAVNTVVIEGGTLRGESTDGPGFLDALAAAGIDVSGRRCVVLGAGGAARAVVMALAGTGAADVAVWGRTPERAAAAAALAGETGRVVALDGARHAELVVNATPVGMAGDGPPLPAELLHHGQTVVDLVYSAAETPLLREARARGATAIDGLGMLVHQAAHAFALWTGCEPPIEAMEQAAAAAAGRGSIIG